MKTNFTSKLRSSRWVRLLIWSATILTPLLLVAYFALPLATARVSKRPTQAAKSLAPGAPIHPVSVSVVNFKELAAQDAKASERATAAPEILQAVHPPMTIKEPDSRELQQPTESAPRVAGPLAVSPSPAANFLAQEDAPRVGTGTSTIPPDTMGSVGPDKIFTNVNNNYRAQNKTTGAALSTVSINTFWASTGATGVFDPRVQYDPYNNRWLVAAVSSSQSPTSSVLIGVSSTSDPEGTFTLFRFAVGCAPADPGCNAAGEWADFPMLGFNKNWVAIGWNQFAIAGSGVAGKILVMDYPALRAGANTATIFTVTSATNPANFCMHPALTFSASEDTLYVPVHLSSAGANYRLHKITGTSSAPIFTLDQTNRTRTGGGWTQPGGDLLPQTCVGTVGSTCPMTPRLIDAGDSFIRSNVVFRNGNIWYPQTIALPVGGLGQANTHTAAQWTRIDTTGGFVDGGRVEDSTATATNGGQWYAYPSISVNKNDDALIGFSNFASNDFVDAGYAFRFGTDAAGTMRDPVIFKKGEDYYSKDFAGTRNRWGDYSNTVVDPINDLDLWTIQEYAGLRAVQDSQQTTSASKWGTWWAKVQPGGAVPVTNLQFSASNYNVSEGGVSQTITVNRSGDTSGFTDVTFNTSDGSASQSSDYVVASGTFTFAPGETSKTFSVLIVDDGIVENPENFNVTLSNPNGAVLGTPSTATITITDNDTAGSITPAPKRFAASMDGFQETPSNNSTASGTGLVLLDASETSALVGFKFRNLGTPQVSAHIHGPSNPGVAAPILFPLTPPIVNPLVNLSISPTAQQVIDLKAGLHYQNIHSNFFPNGEIRGQLLWNPTLEENFFVRQQYLDFLSRDGDPGGFNFWVGQIAPCQANTQCFHDSTIFVADAFFFEPEFQQTAGFVFRAYRAAFGNIQPFPNPDGSNATEANKLVDYSKYVADRARVVGGASLAAAQLAFANEFVSRAEFTTRYPTSQTASQFVAVILATIQTADGVDLSAQTNALINEYNTGGRGRVLYRLADDNAQNPINMQAFINAEYNRQFALTLYFGYLRRNPDIGGFLFWQGQINSAPVRDVPKQNALVCSFITAAEYQFRFGSKAPRTNNECQ
jgi:hypothetical protein